MVAIQQNADAAGKVLQVPLVNLAQDKGLT